MIALTFRFLIDEFEDEILAEVVPSVSQLNKKKEQRVHPQPQKVNEEDGRKKAGMY